MDEFCWLVNGEGLPPGTAAADFSTDYSGIRVWGCKVTCHIPQEVRQKSQKFALRGETGRLVGYENPGQYRVLLDKTNQVVIRAGAQMRFEEGEALKRMPTRESFSPQADLEGVGDTIVLQPHRQMPGTDQQLAYGEERDHATPLAESIGSEEIEDTIVLQPRQQAATEAVQQPPYGGENDATPLAETASSLIETSEDCQQRRRRPPDRYGWLSIALAGISIDSGNPASRAEALSSPDRREWLAAEQAEIEALNENKIHGASTRNGIG